MAEPLRQVSPERSVGGIDHLREQAHVVRVGHEAVHGVEGRWIPTAIQDVILRWRNAETLHRLAYLAEGMADRPGATSTAEREMGESEEGA